MHRPEVDLGPDVCLRCVLLFISKRMFFWSRTGVGPALLHSGLYGIISFAKTFQFLLTLLLVSIFETTIITLILTMFS